MARRSPSVVVVCTNVAQAGRIAQGLGTGHGHEESVPHHDHSGPRSTRHGQSGSVHHHDMHGPRATDKITSYDLTIQQLSERERDAWGERVHGELAQQFGRVPRDLLVLAGAEYVKALRGLTNRYRTDRLPWTVSLPFGAKKGERMGIGERLQWLDAQARERGEAPARAPRA